MNLREWKYWFRALPWTLKWFVVLILIRPLVDNFYYLKEISPFLSPLYIVGVLTPVLCIVSMNSLPRPKKSRLDGIFKIWSFFVLIGATLVFFYDIFSLTGAEFLIKLTFPVYLYFFLRYFIKSEKDLKGIFTTFMLSSVIVAILLLYEIVVNPIRVEESRGLTRIQGNFGDVLNYATYISISFLISCYFYLKEEKRKISRNKIWLFASVVVLCVLGLFNINHAATFIVFGFIFLLFLQFYLSKGKVPLLFGSLIIIATGLMFGNEFLEEKFTPLVEKDIQVYEGKADTEYLLHGRVGRWKKMMGIYTDESIISQFFGYPVNMEYSYALVGTGAHNEYIRILFLTGYVGLAFFLIFLFNLFKKTLKLQSAQKFIGLGALAVFMLYSVTTAPTFYAPMMYIVMAVFAYVALPVKRKLLR